MPDKKKLVVIECPEWLGDTVHRNLRKALEERLGDQPFLLLEGGMKAHILDLSDNQEADDA